MPARDAGLYAHSATDDLLLFLANHPFEEFTLRELGELLSTSKDTVRRSVDVLEANDLVRTERRGTGRPVRINRARLDLPDGPVLRIPQPEFQEPVREALDELERRLDSLVAILLYGSVARGDADRRSDVDLWVLVEEDRPENQRRAHEVVDELEDRRFDGQRYDYHVVVEGLQSVPAFTEDVARIVIDGIPLYRTETFDDVERILREEVTDA